MLVAIAQRIRRQRSGTDTRCKPRSSSIAAIAVSGAVPNLPLAQAGETLDAESDSHKPLSRPRRQTSVGDSVSERVGCEPKLSLHHAFMIPNIRSSRQAASGVSQTDSHRVSSRDRPGGCREATRRRRFCADERATGSGCAGISRSASREWRPIRRATIRAASAEHLAIRLRIRRDHERSGGQRLGLHEPLRLGRARKDERIRAGVKIGKRYRSRRPKKHERSATCRSTASRSSSSRAGPSPAITSISDGIVRIGERMQKHSTFFSRASRETKSTRRPSAAYAKAARKRSSRIPAPKRSTSIPLGTTSMRASTPSSRRCCATAGVGATPHPSNYRTSASAGTRQNASHSARTERNARTLRAACDTCTRSACRSAARTASPPSR